MCMNPANEHDHLKGIVLEIQRMSTEDGPGLRTTIFFKGCALRCAWCHNPESISPHPQVQWVGSRCIGCKTCLDVCPENALSEGPEGILIDRDRCKGCGTCARECPSTALELLGRVWTPDELAREVAKDKVYFDQSRGGVTASGGEAALQAPFVAAFFKACRERGVSTALDTSGECPWSALEGILPHADLVLFDIKEIDPEKHRAFTGHSNERILWNLRRVRDWMRQNLTPRTLWIRTPVIPGATDREENIIGIGRFLAAHLGDTVTRWELCAFNNLCRDKYTRLGLDWPFREADLLPRDVMERLARVAEATGLEPGVVHWSGATRTLQETSPAEDNDTGLRLVKGCPA